MRDQGTVTAVCRSCGVPLVETNMGTCATCGQPLAGRARTAAARATAKAAAAPKSKAAPAPSAGPPSGQPVQGPARGSRRPVLATLAVVGLVAVFGFAIVASGALTPGSNASPTPAPTLTWASSPGFTIAPGAMAVGRVSPNVALLSDGRVLVAGGQISDDEGTDTAELFDPATGEFSSAGRMHWVRFWGSCTALSDGRVLLAGGSNGSYRMASAELYDRTQGGFVVTGSMTESRVEQAATLLADGRVLLLGGWQDQSASVATAELYSPKTGHFTRTGTMTSGRADPGVVLLKDGRVLVVGGYSGGQALDSAEVFDPATGKFTATGSMGSARFRPLLALLPDGRVLVTGGQRFEGSDDIVESSAEIWDPGSGQFSPTGSMLSGRAAGSIAALPNGTVLVAGGWTGYAPSATAEIYDPQAGRFTTARSLQEGRHSQGTVTLSSGQILLVGGWSWADDPLNSAEVFTAG